MLGHRSSIGQVNGQAPRRVCHRHRRLRRPHLRLPRQSLAQRDTGNRSAANLLRERFRSLCVPWHGTESSGAIQERV